MLKIKDSEPADEELIEAIRRDDREAFKQLYYKYHKMLFRYGVYRLRSSETASDLVQDIFFKLWLKRDKLNPAKSIKAYLYKSLNNSIINYSKLYSSKTTSFGNISDHKTLNGENDPDIKIDVQNAVNQLPEKLKLAYLLSRVEGYKYSEIAEICNISVKAVEKRMSKVFDILRKILNK
jgi:RNA polymerase sigma-70 factor (ECF subfamily)